MRIGRRSLIISGIALCIAAGVGAYLLSNRNSAPLVEIAAPGPKATGSKGSVFPFRRVVALVVGINKYPRATGAADLAYAEADAQSMADLFSEHYGYEVVRLTGAAATKSAVEGEMQRLCGELTDGDALVVFFAGHGQIVELAGFDEEGFLIPCDAALDLNDRSSVIRWREQTVSMKSLAATMEQSSAQHILFIADACCSGCLAHRGGLERWDLKSFLSGKSRAVLTATTRRQLARENTAEKHGHFTAALLRELAKNDAASALDIYSPVVRSIAAKTNGTMTPQFASFGEGEGMFVFVPRSIPQGERESDMDGIPPLGGRTTGLAGVSVRSKERAAQGTTYEDFLAVLNAIDERGAFDPEVPTMEWPKRAERFSRNASAGEPWAIACMALCCECGLGMARDGPQAYSWAKRADQFKKPEGVGRYLLGRCCEYGMGDTVAGRADRVKAEELYAESATKGFLPGRWASGRAQLRNCDTVNPVPKSPEGESYRTAIKHLRAASEAGIAGAMVDLGKHYLGDAMDDEGLHRLGSQTKSSSKNRLSVLSMNLAEGKRLLSSACQLGSAAAHFRLYIFYSRTLFRDPVKAENYLLRAIELGSLDALVEYGNELAGHSEHLELSPQPKRAFEKWDRAARFEHPFGLAQSAKALGIGKVVGTDHAEAKTRLEKAIRLGSPYADKIQGEWYLSGTVYPKVDAQALEAFSRGADRGDPECCYRAGRLYFEGRGFTVRKEKSDGVYHDLWYKGLHYFASALAGNFSDPKEKKVIVGTIGNFVNELEGGDLSQRIDKALREMERGTFDSGYQKLAGGKNGGPGQRRSVQFKNSEATNVTLRGEFITRATLEASNWKKEYPDSFAYFCQRWNVDPKTLAIRDEKYKRRHYPVIQSPFALSHFDRDYPLKVEESIRITVTRIRFPTYCKRAHPNAMPFRKSTVARPFRAGAVGVL